MKRHAMLCGWVAVALLGATNGAMGRHTEFLPPGRIAVVFRITKGNKGPYDEHTFVPVGKLLDAARMKKREQRRYNFGGALSQFQRKPGAGPSCEMICGGHVLYTLVKGVNGKGHWDGCAPKSRLGARQMAGIMLKFVDTSAPRYNPETALTGKAEVFDVVYWGSYHPKRGDSIEHVSIVVDTTTQRMGGHIETKDENESTLRLNVPDFSMLGHWALGPAFMSGWGGRTPDLGLNKYKKAWRFRLLTGVKVEWFYWTPEWNNPKGINLTGTWEVTKGKDEGEQYRIEQRPIESIKSSDAGDPPLSIRDDEGNRFAVGGFQKEERERAVVYRSEWQRGAPPSPGPPELWHKRMKYKGWNVTAEKIEWQKWDDVRERYDPYETWKRKLGFQPRDSGKVDPRFLPRERIGGVNVGSRLAWIDSSFDEATKHVAPPHWYWRIQKFPNRDAAVGFLKRRADVFRKRAPKRPGTFVMGAYRYEVKYRPRYEETSITWYLAKRVTRVYDRKVAVSMSAFSTLVVERDVFVITFIRDKVKTFNAPLEAESVPFIEKSRKLIDLRFPPPTPPPLPAAMPTDARPDTKQLSKVLWANRLREALEEYARLAQAHPNHVTIRTGRASLALALGDLNAAAQQAEALGGQFPDNANVLVLRGQVAQWRGDLATARQMYQRALAVHPTQGEEVYGQGVKLYKRRVYPLAVLLLNTALAMDHQQYHEAHHYLGVIYEAGGLRDRAIQEHKAYLQAAPTGNRADKSRERLDVLRRGNTP